jgi:type VI secretion system protein ImpE
MVWLPAHFTWSNGGEGVGLIPTRYPGTENSGDTALCLARKTDWVDTPGGGVEGLGQRMLATDRGEFPMLEVRDIQLDVAGS